MKYWLIGKGHLSSQIQVCDIIQIEATARFTGVVSSLPQSNKNDKFDLRMNICNMTVRAVVISS